MDKKSVEIARAFAKRLRKVFDLNNIFLFGSRARGDNFLESDFDFVIVSEDFKNIPFIFRASKIYDYWNQKQDIEPLCYTPEEFEKKKKQIGIVRQAVKEGIEL